MVPKPFAGRCSSWSYQTPLSTFILRKRLEQSLSACFWGNGSTEARGGLWQAWEVPVRSPFKIRRAIQLQGVWVAGSHQLLLHQDPP